MSTFVNLQQVARLLLQQVLTTLQPILKKNIVEIFYYTIGETSVPHSEFPPKKKKSTSVWNDFLRTFSSDPFGARTQDPNIKSVVLYLLS